MPTVTIKCCKCGRTFQEHTSPGDERPGRCPECANKHFVEQYYWPYGSKMVEGESDDGCAR